MSTLSTRIIDCLCGKLEADVCLLQEYEIRQLSAQCFELTLCVSSGSGKNEAFIISRFCEEFMNRLSRSEKCGNLALSTHVTISTQETTSSHVKLFLSLYYKKIF